MELESLKETVVRIDERSKRNEGRIKVLEESQETLNRLVTSVELIAKSQTRIEEDVKSLTGKVDQLENADGVKWRNLLKTILGLVLGAVAGLVFAKIGLV